MQRDATVGSISRSTDEQAYNWIESIRWSDGEPVCPHCGSKAQHYHLKPKSGQRTTRTGKTSYRKLWKCRDCRKQFSVTVGTCMEGSKIPLRKWAMAFHMLSAGKNGISSHELGRQLDISHESAWFMSHRIRYAFTDQGPQPPLSGTVEADETYVGGKISGVGAGTAQALKTPVVTLVERDGNARSTIMPAVNSKNLAAFIWQNVGPDTTLMTDASRSYDMAGKLYPAHETVDHTSGEYVRGKAHINTAEGYFSQFKRSLDGTHHHVSPKHLHRYVSEFDFRYNARKGKDGERTVRTIRKRVGKPLRCLHPTGRSTDLALLGASNNGSPPGLMTPSAAA